MATTEQQFVDRLIRADEETLRAEYHAGRLTREEYTKRLRALWKEMKEDSSGND